MDLIKPGDLVIVKAREPLPKHVREELERPVKVKKIHGDIIELANDWKVDTKEEMVKAVMRLMKTDRK